MMKFTKQDAVHVQNLLLLLDRGKYELTGGEARAAVEAFNFLSALKTKIMQTIQDEEAAVKAAEEEKAKRAAEAIETTKAVLETLIDKPAEEKA